MKLSFVLLVLSLATLSLAAIPLAEEERSSLSHKRHLESSQPSGKRVKKDVACTAGQSSRVAKKPVKGGKPVPKKPPKKRVGATKGVKTSADTGEKSSAVSGSGKSSQEGSTVLSFPKVLVELIGEYLEGFFVVFARSWSAACNEDRVAVDSERHYLITEQDIQASSHSDGEQVNIGSPDLSCYVDFESSHDGRSLLFTGKTKEQAEDDSSDEITVRWLVQDTGTKSLKNVALESDKTFNGDYSFMLSANGKTLVFTLMNLISSTLAASVYQIKELGETVSASKKVDIPGYAVAVSRNGSRILLISWERQLEIHDASGDKSNPVLKIDYAKTTTVGSCALNNDGSKAAFIVNDRQLYIVDVDKKKGSISIDQLIPIDFPSSVLSYSLVYDAEDRLYAFKDGSLWLVDSSKRELVSLEKAVVPQGCEIQSSAISPNGNYIALLIRLYTENEEREHQYQMIVKRNAKDPFMRLCGH